jgi:hypothetical protein
MFAMAAFLNFKDKRDFHKLQFSPPFLQAYQIWLEYSKGKEYTFFLADEQSELLRNDSLSTYQQLSSCSSKVPAGWSQSRGHRHSQAEFCIGG